MSKFTITLLSISLLSFLSSCTQNAGELNISVNFPKTSPILSEKGKTELKRNIAIKNSELFTNEELEQLGILEVVIK